MKAEELRIGNWVDCYGEHLQVEILEEGCDLAGIKPIPLTPEILEKAGFELFPWGWVKRASNDFGIRLNVKSFSYEVSGNNPVKLQHLHQLQNLFFILCEEELNVQL